MGPPRGAIQNSQDYAEVNSAPSFLSRGAAMAIELLLSPPDPQDYAEVNSAPSFFNVSHLGLAK